MTTMEPIIDVIHTNNIRNQNPLLRKRGMKNEKMERLNRGVRTMENKNKKINKRTKKSDSKSKRFFRPFKKVRRTVLKLLMM
jgi:hypothetical protein